MPRVKQASKQKRTTKAAVKVLGAAGLSFSLVGSSSASTMPTAGSRNLTIPRPISASFLAKRKWPTSVSPRSMSSIGKTLAAACGKPGDAVVAAGRRRVRRLSWWRRVRWLPRLRRCGFVGCGCGGCGFGGVWIGGCGAARLAWAARLAGVAAARGERAACAKSTKSAKPGAGFRGLVMA